MIPILLGTWLALQLPQPSSLLFQATLCSHIFENVSMASLQNIMKEFLQMEIK